MLTDMLKYLLNHQISNNFDKIHSSNRPFADNRDKKLQFERETHMKKRDKNRKIYFLTIVGTLSALVIMLLYNHFSFYAGVVAKTQNMGIGTLVQTKEQLDTYLAKGINAVQTTSIALEYMMEKGESKETIEDFLTYESDKYTKEIDKNFTGLYGLFNGDYIDGIGWIPEKTYQPRERDWYTAAKNANGDTALVSPYLDAQTNTIMMSISKMFPDKDSVISIDLSLDAIQNIMENVTIEDMGYGFVIDKNGLVIAHADPTQKGKNFYDDPQMKPLLEKIKTTNEKCFELNLHGNVCNIFSDTIVNNWHIVLVLDKQKMFQDVTHSLVRNILICGTISALILFFYIFTIKRIQQSVERERETNQIIEQNNLNIVRALVHTIDAKDRYTNGHSVRVAEYVLKIAQHMGKTPSEQQQLYFAGLLHDVGKIRVSEKIINKAGKLTDDEFEQIKLHPVTGYHILKDIYEDKLIATGAKFHHERYDGKGYPNGLAGKNIPEVARIIAVADSYDAMASNRSYRKALAQNIVRDEILKGRGTQFDPQIADIMLKLIDADSDYSLKENRSDSKTILVIDDDNMNLKRMDFILKDEPLYKIIGVTTGNQALETLKTTPVDLILLDVKMPDMDGFETLALIKKEYSIPVVFMTGDKDIETLQKASDLGAEDYITKPFLPLAIKEIIHSILNY